MIELSDRQAVHFVYLINWIINETKYQPYNIGTKWCTLRCHQLTKGVNMSASNFTLQNGVYGNVAVHSNHHGFFTVQLHATNVFTMVSTDRAWLNTAGYKTSTTKKVINRTLEQVGSNKKIIQKKGEWFIIDTVEKTGIKFEESSLMIEL